MGNWFSGGTTILSGSAVTRTELLKATSNSRDFTNKLFNAMITKITPTEILSLSNPATCSKYVFLMANSIEKIFEDLKIKPGRYSSGIVYYQRADKLTAKNPETREICLLIAYFHIRLFQIFGALALTIIDDTSAGSVLGVLHREAEAGRYKYQLQQVSGRPGFWGGPVYRPGSRPTVLTGGALDESEFSTVVYRQFRPLANILSESTDELDIADRYTGKKYNFDDSPRIYLVFAAGDAYVYYNNNEQDYFARIKVTPNIIKAPPGYGTPRYGVPGYAYGVPGYAPPPYGVPDVSKQLIVELSNFRYNNKSDPSVDLLVQPKLRISPVKIYITLYEDNWYDTKDLSKKFTDSLENEFIKKINTIVKTVTKVDAGVPGRPGVPGTGSPGGPGRMSDVGASGPLITQYIIDTIKNISKGGNASFCVARALQLMDAQSSFQPKAVQIRSSVCKNPYEALPTSVPQQGRKLIEVPGIRALEQLYHVEPHYSPTAEKIDFTFDVQYSQLLSKMRELFNPTSPETSVDKITATMTDCRIEAKKYLNIDMKDTTSINKIIGFSKALFGIQLTHTKNVINFFKTRLFIPKKSDWSQIDIHPKLLDGNLKALEEVTKDARNLLLKYYSDCEMKYKLGVDAVLASKHTVS